jgi:signal transduction histidine kinase
MTDPTSTTDEPRLDPADPGCHHRGGAERELVARIQWLMHLRWAAAASVIVFGAFVVHLYRTEHKVAYFLGILGLASAIAAYNALFTHYWRKMLESGHPPRTRAHLFANLQIGVDLLALTAYALLTGGPASPVLSHFVFHVIFASILLSTRAAYAWATVATGLGTLVIFLGAAPGQLAIVPEGILLGRFPLMVFAGFVALVYLSAYLATHIVQRLRQHEAEARRFLSQLQAKADELSQANQNLQSAQMMQTAYMRRVSHELRSPLSAISNSLQVVGEGYAGDLPDRAEQIVGRAHGRIEDLLRMVNDLLALSRARSTRPREYLEPISLSAVTAEVCELLGERAELKGVTLINEMPPELPNVLGDREEIVQLVTNLTANAIKYTEEQGTVNIRGREEAGQVVVEVADTGIGIDEDELPNLFQEFYRTKRGRDYQAVGTGLGLAITRAIVDQHGGTIEVASKVGEGSTFTVRLPQGGPGSQRVAG